MARYIGSRFPQGAEIPINAFHDCGWLMAVNMARRENKENVETYAAMWQLFADFAVKAIKRNKAEEAKALWLLTNVCSLCLNMRSTNPKREHTPTLARSFEQRIMLPQEFQKNEIEFFAKIVETTAASSNLCAIIADILWLSHKTKSSKYALLAIDNYRKIPIHSLYFLLRDGYACWNRAIHICLELDADAEGELKKNAKGRMLEIEERLLAIIEDAKVDSEDLSLHISVLFRKLKPLPQHQLRVANKLEQLAAGFANSEASGAVIEEDLDMAMSYFEAAAGLFQDTNNEYKRYEMVAKTAECCEKIVAARQTPGAPSHLFAIKFYGEALKKYKSIPSELRANYGIDERVAATQEKLRCAIDKNEKMRNRLK